MTGLEMMQAEYCQHCGAPIYIEQSTGGNTKRYTCDCRYRRAGQIMIGGADDRIAAALERIAAALETMNNARASITPPGGYVTEYVPGPNDKRIASGMVSVT